jgi:glycerophosphoryl diester phosphodiesterase
MTPPMPPTPPKVPARGPHKRPLVIAHRGASAELPEHTLVAYVRAIDVGVDGLECDVRLTRDEQLVCVHDRTVDRTSNGTGPVSTKTLAELQRLDFGSWHAGQPQPVLRLFDLLNLMRDAGRFISLLVEAKHPTRYAGRVEQKLIEALERYGWTGTGGPVTVMSFARTALTRIHGLAPELPTVLLLDRNPLRRRIGLLPPSIAVAGPSIELLRADPSSVERAHLLGHQVYVWTVDERSDVEFACDLGVDAIITNQPAETLSVVSRAASP